MRCCSCRRPFPAPVGGTTSPSPRTARVANLPRRITRWRSSHGAAESSLRLHMCSAPHFMRAKMRTGPRERSLLMHTRRSPMLQRGSASFTSTRISASLLRRSLRAQSHVAAEMCLCSGLTQRQKNSRLLASLDATTPMALLRTQRLMQSGRPTYAQRLRSPCAHARVPRKARDPPPLLLLHIRACRGCLHSLAVSQHLPLRSCWLREVH